MLLSNFTNFEEFHSSWRRDIVLDVEERRNQFTYEFPSGTGSLKFIIIHFQLPRVIYKQIRELYFLRIKKDGTNVVSLN